MITQSFPKEEVYGLTSQLRRAALSINLNIIEGFARFHSKDFLRFLQISYGSLKETKYLLNFSYKEKYINSKDYTQLLEMTEEVGKILWKIIEKLDSKVNYK